MTEEEKKLSKKQKICSFCKESKKVGNKFCAECGKQVNDEFDDSQYNYYCEECSDNKCAEHVDVFDRKVYCPKCGKLTKNLLTPL